jgi:hypothetical protein
VTNILLNRTPEEKRLKIRNPGMPSKSVLKLDVADTNSQPFFAASSKSDCNSSPWCFVSTILYSHCYDISLDYFYILSYQPDNGSSLNRIRIFTLKLKIKYHSFLSKTVEKSPLSLRPLEALLRQTIFSIAQTHVTM